MDTPDSTPLDRAAEIITTAGIARACGVSHTAVYLWRQCGFLPRTDFTGETDYAGAIEQATDGAVTRDELREAHNRGPAAS